MKKGRFRAILTAMAILVATLFATAFVACAPPEPTAETGVYYYASESDEYIVSLGSDGTAVVVLKDLNVVGSYKIDKDGTTVKFDFDDKAAITATYENDVLSVTYDGSTMRFLKKIDYTVSFDTAGGSPVAQQTVVNGKTVKKPDDPTRDGRVFLGWYADEAFSTPFAFGQTPVTADTVVYARWSESYVGVTEYDVTFDLNYAGGGVSEFESIRTIGGHIYDVPTPAREGYDFGGWWISDFEDGDRLTYKYESSVVFGASTTLFAQWLPKTSGGKLAMPLPSVQTNDTVVWDAITGAMSYEVIVKGPDGRTLVNEKTLATTVSPKFSSNIEGEYTVTVKAIAQTEANNSDTATRSFNNKALQRVSVFSVLDPSMLVYNAVDHAERYRLDIVCGNPEHKHTAFDNGLSTYYNFGSCDMKEGGIAFTVAAMAEGYAPSVSKTFYYDRSLGKIEEFFLDKDNELVYWTPVANAADYEVKVTIGDETTPSYVVRTGGKPSVSLTSYRGSKVSISVTPKASGYNSKAESFVYNRGNRLSAPQGVKIVGGKVVWTAVEGATDYTVKIGEHEYTATAAEYDLSNELLSNNVDYAVSVRANGAESSAYSDEFIARFYSMSPSIIYSDGYVSWRHVIGAVGYRVRVNGAAPIPVDAGVTSAVAILTRAGSNTVEVSYTDDSGFMSDWIGVTVYAYELKFDPKEGEETPSVYKASGEKVTLPETTRVGYDLDGWYNVPGTASVNGKKFESGDTMSISGDMILYANWTPKKYTITYVVGENETIDNETATVTYTKDYKLDVPVNTDTSMIFVGWNSSADGTGVEYTDYEGNGITPWNYQNDVTLYSVWESMFEFELQEGGRYDNEYALVGLTQAKYAATRIVIPETYKGLPVTIVEGRAIHNTSQLRSVAIPDTIKVVYDTAFDTRTLPSLEEIEVYETGKAKTPLYSSYDGVLYWDNVEAGTGIQVHYVPSNRKGHVVIPSGTKVIPLSAFASSKINSLVIPSTVVTIEDRAFYYNRNIEDIYFDLNAGDKLKIGEDAFTNCTSLKAVTLPDRLENFDPVTLFEGCPNIETLELADTHKTYSAKNGMLYSKDGATIVYCPPAKRGAITIDSTVRTIGEKAFYNATKFHSITFSPATTSIKKSAFENCAGLTSITFRGGSSKGDEVTVEADAFKGCIKLTQITFGENSNVTSLASGAFADCTKLSAVTIPATVESFEAGVFTGCTALAGIKVDADHPYLTSVDGIVFSKDLSDIKYYSTNRSDKEYTIPSTVTKIGDGIFAGNLNIKKIYIDHAITEIGARAFDSCTALDKLVFVGAADYQFDIGDYAFNGCGNFRGFFTAATATTPEENYANVFPQGIKSIGKYAFNHALITNVTLGEGIKEIGEYAFAESSVRTLSIPASVEVIGNNAFYYCRSLNSVTVATGTALKTIAKRAFYGCPITTFTVPKTVTTLGDSAFDGTRLTEVLFEDGRTETITLGFSVFDGSRITRLELPDDSEISIEQNPDGGYYTTFGYGEGLEYIKLGKNETSAYRFDNNAVLWAKKDGEIAAPIFVSKEYTGEIVIPKTVTYLPSGVFASSKSSKISFELGGTEELVAESGVFRNVNLNTDPWDFVIPARLSALSDFMFQGAGIGSISFEEGCKWTEFPQDVFMPFYNMRKLKKVTMPKNLKTLNDIFRALGRSTLETVVLNDGLEIIDSGAFYGNSMLKSINIPDSVKEIGGSAFDSCRSLTSITFSENSNLALIGYNAFGGTGITSFKFPKTFVGEYYTDKKGNGDGVIAARMFYGCSSLTSIDFNGNNNITSIGDNVFEYCPIEELVLPSTLTSVGSLGIDPTRLKKITISAGVTADAFSGIAPSVLYAQITIDPANKNLYVEPETNAIYSGDKKRLLFYPGSNTAETYSVLDGTTTISSYAFYDNKVLKSVVLPSTLTTIAPYAFGTSNAKFSRGEYPSLESIEIPTNVSSIGEEAFYGCANLKTLTFGSDSGLNTIGERAFYGCKELTEVVLPAKLAKIGDYAGGSTEERYGSNVFYGCTKLERVTLPVNITDIYPNTFAKCDNLVTVTVPQNAKLEKIWQGAFGGCARLTALDFENAKNLNDLVGGAFDGCFELSSIVFNNNSQLKIGDMLFVDTAITSLTLPEKVVSIGNSAFEGLAGFTSVVLPENSTLLSIGDSAFRGTGITEFAFANAERVTDIGAYAFYETGLSGEIALSDNVINIGEYAFYNCNGITELTLGKSIKSIGKYAFYKLGITSLEIYGNDTEVGDKAFADCTGLGTLKLNEGVVSLGNLAFANAAITEVAVPSSVITIDGNPFAGCPIGAGNLTLPETTGLVYKDNMILNKEETILYYVGPTVTGAFTLNEKITRVMPGAFAGSGISSITLPDSFTEIPDSLFKDCKSLASVTIGKNITVIGESAFEGCTALKTVTFEKGGLKPLHIYARAFYGSGIETVVLPHRLRNYETYTIESDPDWGDTIIPYNHAGLGESAFENCLSLRSVSFEIITSDDEINTSGYHEEVLTMGKRVFFGDTALETFIAGEAFEEDKAEDYEGNLVGESAFEGCTSLSTVSFVEKIPDLEEFTYVNLSGGIVGKRAFYGCTSLKSFNVVMYMSLFEEYAFANSGLEEITFPNYDGMALNGGSVLEQYTFGAHLFDGCKNLTKVTVEGHMSNSNMGEGHVTLRPDVGEYLFKDCSNLEVVEFANVSSFLPHTFDGCTSLKTVTINFDEEGNGSIGESMFDGCVALTDLTVTGNLNRIRANAFKGCTGLTSFIIPETVTTVDATAFAGWTVGQTIYVPYDPDVEGNKPTGWAAGFSADATVAQSPALSDPE